MNIIFKRIICDLLIAIAVINGWWFVAISIGILSVWIFPYFIEIVIAGFFYDSLFGYNSSTLDIAGYYGTISTLIIIVVSMTLKSVLRR